RSAHDPAKTPPPVTSRAMKKANSRANRARISPQVVHGYLSASGLWERPHTRKCLPGLTFRATRPVWHHACPAHGGQHVRTIAQFTPAESTDAGGLMPRCL